MKPRDLLMAEETLFRDESVFTPAHVPADFSFRDDQLNELTLAVKPGLRGVNPVNALVTGPPGTGKTTAVKYVMSEIRESTSALVPVYVNCEDHATQFAVFSRIHEEVYGHKPPETGKPLEVVKEKIFSKLKREDKSLLVALDEIDHLFAKNIADKVLIDLLKTADSYGYGRVGVFGVLVDDVPIAGLSDKTRSVYNPTRISFPPYARGEMRDILAQRTHHGFYAGVMSDGVLDLVVEKAQEHGDIRVGIDLLRRSAYAAERDASRAITADHVEGAYAAESRMLGLRRTLSALDEEARAMLSILSSSAKGALSSKELHDTLNEERPISGKAYNQLVQRLEFYALVDSAYKVGGRGRSRDIVLRQPLEDVRSALAQTRGS